MFCEKCGQKLDDDAKFCDKCGAPVEGAQPQQPDQPASPVKAPKPAGQGKDFLKKHGKVLGISAAVLAVVIGLLVFFLTRPVTVKLNDYISVEFRGCDTVGSADFRFDSDKFQADYKDKFEFKKSDDSKDYSDLLLGMAYGGDPCRILEDACLNGHLSKDEELKNGEEIQFVWECQDEKAMDYFHVKLDYENITFKVEGLKQAEKVNPLDSLKLKFDGISPFVRADDDQSAMPDYARYSLQLEMEPRKNLKNGDTVTVTIANADSESLKQRLLEEYGYVLEETSKTFTVEGMPEYMTDVSQMEESASQSLKKQAEDLYTSYAAKNWETGKVDALDYQGMYLLTQKSEEQRFPFNRLFVLYQVTASEPLPTEAPAEEATEAPTEEATEAPAEEATEAPTEEVTEAPTEETTEASAEETTEAPTEEATEVPAQDENRAQVTYYMGVYFDNLIVNADGTIQVDPASGEMLRNSIRFEEEPFKYLYYRGYKTVEDLVKDCITSNTDQYTYTTTMN